MIEFVINRMYNPLSSINVDLGKDMPLYKYVQKAINDLEILNILHLNPIEEEVESVKPFIHIGGWKWNPHPPASELQYKRRETGDKLSTKSIDNSRLGILEFDILYGARDKNRNLEQAVEHNKIFIPIEDDKGRYLLGNTYYSEFQLVDKLLYPSGKDSITLKSLLPIKIKYDNERFYAIDGEEAYDCKIGNVQIFKTMEPIITCFMHVPSPLAYLGVHPLIQFCDEIGDDLDEYVYFKPNMDIVKKKNTRREPIVYKAYEDDSTNKIFVKAYRKALEKFEYVRSILGMAVNLIEQHKPGDIDDLNNPKWWVYKLSHYENIIEHRGACHEMHVARMLDTISAQVLPLPECDKKIMISILRYVLQTEFESINIFSYDNKRLRLNEVVSTIVTAQVSAKLKSMFRFGALIKTKEMAPLMKFNPQLILKNINKLGTIHTSDFTNDLDYTSMLKCTKKGPNSLGRTAQKKITFSHRQMDPSMIGKIDLIESTKDVGQSFIVSPWGNLDGMMVGETSSKTVDRKCQHNMKYELFDFIRNEFPNPAIQFNAKTPEEFDAVLDKLVMYSQINMHYNI